MIKNYKSNINVRTIKFTSVMRDLRLIKEKKKKRFKDLG